MDHPITLTHQGGGNGNGINVSPPLTPTLQQQQQQQQQRGSEDDETRNLVSTATGRIQLLPMNSSIRPPTPAPSPQPRSRAQTRESITQVQQQLWTSTTINKQQQQQQQQQEEEEEELINRLRLEINQLPSNLRQQLLTLLINDSTPSNLSPLIHLITPRLKRDFLKTLPIELSFHVLSFVDEVKTLARASGVSRFWRALLQDETTWKRMCWKSGFGNAPLPPPPQPTLPPPTLLPTQTDDSLSLGSLEEYSFGNNNNNNGNERSRRNLIRNLEFGRLNEPISREDEFFTPAGRERRGTLDRTGLQEFAARAELFDLPPPPPPPPPPRRGSTATTTQQQRGSRDESDLAREREGSWSDAPPPVSTTTTSTSTSTAAEAEAETSSTSNEMGLGFATSIITTSQPSSSSRSTTTSVSQQQQSLPSLVSPPMFSLPSTSSPIPHNKPLRNSSSPPPPPPPTSTSTSSLKEIDPFSYKTHFKRAYLTESSWLRGPGRLLSTQMSADDGVVTSLGFDQEWIIVGMATSKIHVFESENGRYVRTLEGHELGVWCLTLVGKSTSNTDDDGNNRNRRDETEEEEESEFFSGHTRSNTSFDINYNSSSTSRTTFPRRRRSFPGGFTSTTINNQESPSLGGMGLGAGGRTGDSSQQSGVCSTAKGWGQSGGARVISGGCDREVRVWKVETGECLHTLRGHTSTVRCMRVLNGRPLAVSGSRDSTLRVWDLEKGECLHLLSGHEHSVRCIEVSGNKVVSGSYDATCRLWDVDTGECLHVFRGHIHQIYAVAFDGIRVVTGSLDSTVRIWSAETGEFLALLQGHTSLVGQLILLPSSKTNRPTLVTGGSDGRVIVFDLESFDTVHRLCAHDNSVTCLQVDERFIVTGGNDGRIKLWDFKTGLLIRELIEPCGAVWRVVFRDDKCVTLCRREGKTLMDVRTFRPSEQELYG